MIPTFKTHFEGKKYILATAQLYVPVPYVVHWTNNDKCTQRHNLAEQHNLVEHRYLAFQEETVVKAHRRKNRELHIYCQNAYYPPHQQSNYIV